jgi:hypothetical protein
VTTLAATAAADPASAPPSPAAPPDKEACVSAFDRGQRAQSDRALRRAQSELIVCSQESCPTVLRADCAGVLAEVRAALPTIVFAADDGNGRELTDVKVYAGSELLASTLDGRAIAVDPGTFDLRFERAGQPAVVASRTLREGEKSRVIRVSLGGGSGFAVPPRVPSSERIQGTRSAAGWALPGALAAVGLASVGVAIYTRLRFDSRVDELRTSCAPECTQAQRSDLSGTLVTSNVALGVGVGALALAALAWFLTAPSSVPSSTSASTRTSSGAGSRGLVPGAFTW